MSTISIKNLSFAYNGQDLLFDNVSLSLDSQWKLGLLGRNGRGKTTLLNIIQGKLDYSGKISANIDFEYFPQAISDKDNLFKISFTWNNGNWKKNFRNFNWILKCCGNLSIPLVVASKLRYC